MADYEMILKCWGPVEADYNTYGGLVLNRYFTKYPDSLKLFPFFENMTQAERASNQTLCCLGATKLRKMHAWLKLKGKHGTMIKPLAIRHGRKYKAPINSFQLITEVVAEVMGEKAGLDATGQQALKTVMAVVWDDFKAIYKELGLAL